MCQPGSPLPSCTQGLLQVLGLMAGRGIADRARSEGAAAQAPCPGLSQAAPSASRESHQEPAALCTLAAHPGERCLQKSWHPGLG